MRRKFLVTSIILSTSLLFSGCSIKDKIAQKISEKEMQKVNEYYKDYDYTQYLDMDDTTEEDESDEYSEDEQTVEPYINVEGSVNTDEWCLIENGDTVINVQYAKGVSDDFLLTDNCRFEELCNWLKYTIPDYDTEVFRHVFSEYFEKESFYTDISNLTNREQQVGILSKLAALSWTLTNLDGDTTYMTIDRELSNLYTFYIESDTYGMFSLTWNVFTDDVMIDAEVDYNVHTFSESNLDIFVDAINGAFNNDEVIINSKIENREDIIEHFKGYLYIADRAEEAIEAIESYYDSKIIAVEDDYVGEDKEAADIILENGSVCRYYAAMYITISIYDKNDEHNIIWMA